MMKNKFVNINRIFEKEIKQIFSLLFFAIVALLISSCEDEQKDLPMIDWYPVSLYIFAEDTEGNDLIKEEMEGMSLTYRGETYEVTTSEITRHYGPVYIHGLIFRDNKWFLNDPTAHNCLVFGELDGSLDMDEEFVLTWPDGSKNTIHYHCSDHKYERNPSCVRTWTLDGKAHDGDVFKFVK